MNPGRPYHAYTSYHREPGGLRRLDFFVDRISFWRASRPAKEIRVLDIGCGNGNISLPLASLGYDVTGVDMDEKSIQSARAQAEDFYFPLEYLVGTLEVVKEKRFDVVIASEVLEHQEDPQKFLEDLQKLVAPGGLLLLSVPNGKSLEERIRKFTTHTKLGLALKTRLKKSLRSVEVQSQAGSPHVQFFSWREVQDVLYRGGWKIKEADRAACLFKEFFYLGGKFLLKRGSAVFHFFDGLDARLSDFLPFAVSDGWLLETRSFDSTKPLVLQVLPTLSGGGAERIAFELAKRLPERGFASEVISILRGGQLEEEVRKSGVSLRILGRRGLLGLSATCALYRLMRFERPAVVHTHLFGADVWGRIAAWFARVPAVISTEHNVNLDHGAVKARVKSLLAAITDLFVAVSNDVKAYMVAKEGIPEAKVQVIRNGIDLSRVLPRPEYGFPEIPRLIVVARLMPQKGHDVLFKALANVPPPWLLRVVGTGESEASLRDLAERLGILSRIEWLGFRDDVPALLADSDVFCFPSRWEGLGLAVLEAAAAGVPIVSSDLPAVREVVDPSHAAFVPVDDPEAFAVALNAVLKDPESALARARDVRPVVSQRFSLDRMIVGYEAAYHRLLKAKP